MTMFSIYSTEPTTDVCVHGDVRAGGGPIAVPGGRGEGCKEKHGSHGGVSIRMHQ